MSIAYLGLGSNLGNRLAFLRGGRDSLVNRFNITLCRASGVYETEALGGPAENPPFLNTVLEIDTLLEPRDLLAACMAVEEEFGRTRMLEWEPRTLDIDLLLYGDVVIDDSNLQIPHPRLQERDFVLAPLIELAADLQHPVLQKTIRGLANDLPLPAGLVPLRTSW